MRKLVFAVAAFLWFPLLADANSAKLTPADTVATLDFPDSWKISKIKRGIEAKSPDQEVYVWAELVPSDEVDAVQKEHDAYFEKQKVTMAKADPSPRMSTAANGLSSSRNRPGRASRRS